ncbi:MAG: hypothetical protein ABI268_07770 [Rhodanobacter sp.]
MDHQASTYSQSGEDGIIGKILETLPERDHWCVEFGALDGTSLSNTRNLIEHADYSAVLIEASKGRFNELQSNYARTEKVTTLNRFVGFSANDNLDHILADTAIPEDFDFLSIDIDGNDYHVWKSTSRFVPKAVCIEFNHTIPNEVKFIQPADPKITQGSSLSALVELGKVKGYELVCVEGVNAFFVRSAYFPLFGIDDNSVAVLRTDLSAITWLFIGYDGTIFLEGRRVMPWHAKLPLKASRMQRLPKLLRKFSDSYNPVERIAFAAYLLLSSPKTLLGEMKKRSRIRKS